MMYYFILLGNTHVVGKGAIVPFVHIRCRETNAAMP